MQVYWGQSKGRVVAVCLVLSLGCWLCGRGVLRGADEPKSEAKRSTSVKPKDIPQQWFNLPAGNDPKDLLKFIHKIDSKEVEFETEAEAEQFLTKSRTRIIEAADRLLKSKPTSEQEVEALKAKLMAYRVLLIVGVPNTMPKALQLAEQLKNDKRPELAENGAVVWLELKMSTIATAGEKDRQLVLEAIAAMLSKKPQSYFEAADQFGRILEMVGDGKTAAAAYATFGEILSRNLNDRIHEAGEKMKTGAVRRARLLSGEPVKVSGKTLDGKPFDISQYKGKVVVVDFWATWCGPCLAELPNLKSVYEKYHSKGLEVIGISLDDDKEKLAEFIKENQLPWKILVSTDPQKKSFADPVAEYYGISGIPTVFLMNREGKVVSLAARGEQLVSLVGQLLDLPAK